MPMRSFHEFVGERAWAETRTVIVPEGRGPLRPGTYAFVELYCDETGCDCRRVFLRVLNEDDATPLATIGFGWETPSFYRAWAHGKAYGEALAGAQLEPLAPQGPQAGYLFALFRYHLLSDPEYVARLQRHYREAKAELERRPGLGDGTARAAGGRGARDPVPPPARSGRPSRWRTPGGRKLGSQARPAIARVHTRERAEQLVELCDEHGWTVIVGIEPDRPEDVSDVERLLRREAGVPPAATRSASPGRNSPCPCGSGKRFKRCCGAHSRGIPGAS
jgi:SWIM/SEC-C metal-binding protein